MDTTWATLDQSNLLHYRRIDPELAEAGAMLETASRKYLELIDGHPSRVELDQAYQNFRFCADHYLELKRARPLARI